MSNQSAKEVLEKAASAAAKFDHCKFRMFNESFNFMKYRLGEDSTEPTACCLLGAVDFANGGYHPPGPVRHYIYKVIGQQYVDDMGSWNDLPTTTKADVVKALTDAAYLAALDEVG